MKQSVNLFLPEFRKEKDWLTAGRMLQVLGAVAVLVLLFATVDYFQLRSARSTLAEAEARRNQTAAATEALLASFGSQAEDQGVIEENLRLVDELNAKQAMLQVISGLELRNTMGFSDYMIDMARSHTEGLRLLNILLQDNGQRIALHGEVSNPGLVPLYLQNLSQGASFRGKSFNDFQIRETVLQGNRSEGLQEMKAWLFDVSTDALEPGAETDGPAGRG